MRGVRVKWANATELGSSSGRVYILEGSHRDNNNDEGVKSTGSCQLNDLLFCINYPAIIRW